MRLMRPIPACAVSSSGAAKFDRIHFCYEVGPTGYGLHRLIQSLGHECMVVAPSLIPRKPGDRVKTNRRDALALARLLRAGELTAVWVPDEGHEAMRDLVRARAAAVETLRVHRQQVGAFMLKHSRIYPRKKAWTMRYLHWLQEQQFDHPAHQIRDHHERSVRESGSFFMPNALTMDIRAVSRSHLDQNALGSLEED